MVTNSQNNDSPAEHFIGREDLLESVLDSLDQGVSLLLQGRAGIGKTRLAAEAASHQSLANRSVDRLLGCEATQHFQLATLAPLGSPNNSDAGNFPAYLSWHLGRWRSLKQGNRLPIVWLDDTQFVDALSASILRHATTAGIIQLLGTHRTTQPLPSDIEQLLTDGLVLATGVPPLSRPSTGILAEGITGVDLSADQLDELYALTAGFPLYIRDLAGTADGAIEFVDLEAIVGRRLARLEPSLRHTAELIAIAEPLDQALLGKYQDNVTDLIDRGVVRRYGSRALQLEHPLYQTWLTEMLGPLVKERFGELIELAGPNREEHPDSLDAVTLANWHLQSSGTIDEELALVACRETLLRSDGQTAQRFARYCPADSRLLLQGEALILSGSIAEGLKALHQVRKEGAPEQRVDATSWIARVVGLTLGQPLKAQAILRDVRVDDLDPPQHRMLLNARLWLWMFGPGGSEDDLDLATTLLHPSLPVDQSSYETALSATGLIYQVRGGVAAETMAARLRQIETEITPDRQAVCRARAIEGWYFCFAGQTRTGLELFQVSLEEALSDRNAEGTALLGGSGSLIAALHGNIDLATSMAGQGYSAVQDIDWLRFGELARLINLGHRCLAGEPVETVAPTVAPDMEGPTLRDLEESFLHRAQALLAERSGNPIDDAAILRGHQMMSENTKHSWLAVLGTDYLSLDRPPALHQFLVDDLSQIPGAGIHQTSADAAAARLSKNADLLLTAGSEYELAGMPIAASRAYTDIVMTSSDDAALRSIATQGLARALRQCVGLVPWWVSDIELLTTRQLEIVAGISDGHSTTEIAERLFLSRRTVQNHLYRMYKILGVHDQQELVHVLSPVAAPPGWVPLGHR